jgi:hypothetical protein
MFHISLQQKNTPLSTIPDHINHTSATLARAITYCTSRLPRLINTNLCYWIVDSQGRVLRTYSIHIEEKVYGDI